MMPLVALVAGQQGLVLAVLLSAVPPSKKPTGPFESGMGGMGSRGSTPAMRRRGQFTSLPLLHSQCRMPSTMSSGTAAVVASSRW